MRTDMDTIAPAFVAMAHRIGYATVATTGLDGAPRTRVMQPAWEWDGTRLTGWVSTTTDAPKVAEVAAEPRVSLTYWGPEQDTCTADALATPVTGADELAACWDRFLRTPAPAGFDPAIHPDWETAASPTFGVLRLDPVGLRVMPGTLMLRGEGTILTWRAPATADA
jgi:general stress protein 26